MMADFMELGQFKQGQNGKWRFIRLGYAKPNPKGGWYLNFDALPLPDENGRVSVAMKEPQERDGQGGDVYSRPVSSGAPMAGVDIEDNIPFSAEWRG
jgi:hypothetical protein